MPNLYATNTFDTNRSRGVWDGQILRFGDLALLRQPSVPDRLVSILPARFTALERMGQASNPTDRKVLLSVYDPSTGLVLDPDPSEREQLITLIFDGVNPALESGEYVVAEKLKMVAPPARIGTNSKPLYWVLQVRA